MSKDRHHGEEKILDETEDFSENGTAAEEEKAAGTHNGKSQEEKAVKAFRELTSDEDEKPAGQTKLTLASILGGDMLGGHWFRRQFWYIVMVVAMLIVYVANRYACQQEMIQTKVLNDTLLDRRYKALTRSSQLKVKTRRSHIEETIADSTIQTSSIPSYNLKIEE